MKKIILAISILISINSFSQSKTDSIQQLKVNRFIDSLNSLPINHFNVWLYETIPAKKRDEFIALYNEYLKAKYNEWMTKPKNK